MMKEVIINFWALFICSIFPFGGALSMVQNADYILSNDIIDYEITYPPRVCPTLTTPYCYCSVDDLTNSFQLRCQAYSYYSTVPPEEVQANLRILKELGPISSLAITDIDTNNLFNYVPDDFLVGNSIPSVTFFCSPSYTTSKPPLTFGIDAFKDTSTGVCGLTGNLTFNDCNLRQFNGEILEGCNQMTHLGFLNNHIETLNRFPRLESLTNLTIYYGRSWSGATQRGLVNFPVTADKVPRLGYLDLTGNSLQDDDVNILIPQLLRLEQLYLEGNNFSSVPDLKNLFYLDIFTILVDDELPEVSVRLPNPRKTALPSLQASVKASSLQTKRLKKLTGDLYNAMVTLDFKMNGTFEQSVFQAPLESLSSMGQLYINIQSRFDCQCTITWLVRDRPQLIDRIRSGGICQDERQFSQIQADELSCCPTNELVARLNKLESENGRLQKELNHLEVSLSQRETEIQQFYANQFVPK